MKLLSIVMTNRTKTGGRRFPRHVIRDYSQLLGPKIVVRTCLLLMAIIVAASSSAFAVDVLFVKKVGSSLTLENQVRRAAQFYGLNAEVIAIGAPSDGMNVIRALEQPRIMAAIVSSDALGDLNRIAIFKALHGTNRSEIPFLIVATGSKDIPSILPSWSGGHVEDCRAIDNDAAKWTMSFANAADFLHPLAGFAPKSVTGPTCGLMLSHSPSARILAEMQNGATRLPTFIDFSIGSQPVFVVAAMGSTSKTESSGTASLQEAFSSIAGLMIFLQHAAGESAWHLPAHYANLTVDDPWLTEPYGNLGYESLLNEMEKHNFHTTIAFVPWNFDRSQPEVVSLFHRNPDRFSISIHGNNHNHREFGEYGVQPLSGQNANIQQAVARMDQFKRTTSLPYDRVMIFPHAVAPAETFAALKKYGYWATVNSENVPLGSKAPDNPLFPLTPWTLAFEGFPSVKRTSAEVPLSTTDIAINAFLGNPQLFYVHQEFFEDHIGAFDATADEINRLEPGIQWKSLGYIVRHLYLTRLRSDHDYDVLAISSNLDLVNPTERRAVFHVHKTGDAAIPLRSLTVNGAPASYRTALNELQFDVVLEPKQSSDVEISYSDGLNLASMDISKPFSMVTVDRRLSDFRDLKLSRSTLGRKIQFAYYKYGFDTIERLVERSVIVLIAVIAGYLLLRLVAARMRRNKHLPKLTSDGQNV